MKDDLYIHHDVTRGFYDYKVEKKIKAAIWNYCTVDWETQPPSPVLYTAGFNVDALLHLFN